MIVLLGLALAFASGVEPRRLALLGAAVYLPFLFAGLVALHWFRTRPDDIGRPPLFCESVAAELRAGANLRDALTTAATSVGLLPESPGLSSEPSTAEVAARVAEELPSIGEELRLTIVAASRSGADAAGLFDEIGSLAIAQSEVRREVRVATAPGRATALILLGAPVIYLVTRLQSGGLAGLIASPEQRVVATIGLGLFLGGLFFACLVLWRASR